VDLNRADLKTLGSGLLPGSSLVMFRATPWLRNGCDTGLVGDACF
jgi:hypothetical protein